MPIEMCASGCGRMISISLIAGGNPEAKRHPEQFASTFAVCSQCRSFFCDRCAAALCPHCGGPVVPGDSQAEAQRRLDATNGDVEAFLEPGALGAFEREVDRFKDQILGLDPDRLDQVAESGSIEIIADRTLAAAPVLFEAARAAGSEADEEQVRGIVHEHLARSFMVGALVELIGRYEPMGLGPEIIEPWYNVDLFLNRRAQDAAGEPDIEIYAGVMQAVFSEMGTLDRALLACAQKSLAMLGLEEHKLSDDLAAQLQTLSTTGLRLACAQAMATQEILAHHAPEEALEDFLFSQLLQLIWASGEEVAEFMPQERLVALFDRLIQREQDSQTPLFVAGLTKLGVLFDLPEILDLSNDLERAKLFMAVGLMSDAHAMYERAAEAGGLEAQYALGILYEVGSGCPEDPAAYARWMRTAADGGYPAALGECYGDGIGVARDEARGRELVRQSAEAGDTFAMGSMGGWHLQQEPPEVERAVAWFRRARAGGNWLAARVLDDMGGEDESD